MLVPTYSVQAKPLLEWEQGRCQAAPLTNATMATLHALNKLAGKFPDQLEIDVVGDE